MSNVKHAMAQVKNLRGDKSLAAQLAQLGFGQVEQTVARLDTGNRSANPEPVVSFDWNSAVRGALVWR